MDQLFGDEQISANFRRVAEVVDFIGKRNGQKGFMLSEIHDEYKSRCGHLFLSFSRTIFDQIKELVGAGILDRKAPNNWVLL